jgi:hypothetical protein
MIENNFLFQAAIIACNNLIERMQVVADSMDNPTWEELVAQCYIDGVDLTSKHM